MVILVLLFLWNVSRLAHPRGNEGSVEILSIKTFKKLSIDKPRINNKTTSIFIGYHKTRYRQYAH